MNNNNNSKGSLRQTLIKDFEFFGEAYTLEILSRYRNANGTVKLLKFIPQKIC